jgi:hypothetical protein
MPIKRARCNFEGRKKKQQPERDVGMQADDVLHIPTNIFAATPRVVAAALKAAS